MVMNPDGTWYQYGQPLDEAILEQAELGNAVSYLYLQAESGQLMDKYMFTFPFRTTVCDAIEAKYPDVKLVNVRKQAEIYPQRLEDYLEGLEDR